VCDQQDVSKSLTWVFGNASEWTGDFAEKTTLFVDPNGLNISQDAMQLCCNDLVFRGHTCKQNQNRGVIGKDVRN